MENKQRLIQIQYPDETFHTVKIYNIFQTVDDEIVAEYWDLSANGMDSFTVLINNNGVLEKNSNHKDDFSFYDKRRKPANDFF